MGNGEPESQPTMVDGIPWPPSADPEEGPMKKARRKGIATILLIAGLGLGTMACSNDKSSGNPGIGGAPSVGGSPSSPSGSHAP